MKRLFRPLPLATAVALACCASPVLASYTNTVEAGTTVSGETVDGKTWGDGGYQQNVYGSTDNITITDGGEQVVQSGGVSANSTVAGTQIIANGGVTNGSAVQAHGTLEVSTGGVSNGTTLTGDDAKVTVADNGTTNNTVINAGGQELLRGKPDAPAISNGSVINEGGYQQIGMPLDNPYQQDIRGIATGATINGGVQDVDHGQAIDTVINSGTQNVNAGGVATGTVMNGGTQNIDGGQTTGTVLNKGEIVQTGGTADQTTINGGTVTIGENYRGDGGQMTNTVMNGGELYNDGGTDTGTTINAGTLYTGSWDKTGHSVGTVINGGAQVVQGTDSTATGTTLNRGTLTLTDGTLTDTTLNGGAFALMSGAADNTLQLAGDVVQSGGMATGSTLSGGTWSLNGGNMSGTTINNGSLTNTGGMDTDTQVVSGLYTLDGVSASSQNLSVGTQGYAQLTDGFVSGETVNDGQMQIGGDMTVNGIFTSGADSVTQLQQGANVTADMNVGGTLTLANTGTDGSASYSFTDVTLNDASVVYDSSSYATVNMTTISGSGTFYMNTSIGEQEGDFLNVSGNATGSYDVFVADTGVSPVSPESLALIHTGGGDAQFALANTGGVVDVGTYEYHLAGQNGDWSLTPDIPPAPPAPPVPPDPDPTPDPDPEPPAPAPEPQPDITPSTAAVLNMATVDPLIWQAELGSVRRRLDEARTFTHDATAWTDIINTRNNVLDSAGAGYHQTMNGITVGADQTLQRTRGVTTRGLFFTYSHSDLDFDRGGDGNVDSYSVGGYASYLDNNGGFIDGVIKGSRFENDVNGRMTSGGAADGYYATNGLGASLKGGKYLHYGATTITPYLSLTGFTTDSSHYTLSNGMHAHVGNERSVLAEAGLNAAHAFTLKDGAVLQPFVQLAVTQEFIDDNHVDVNSDGHFDNDLSGTRGVYQLGLNARLTKTLNAHAGAAYAQGANVESPWAASAGLAWSF
mgnify:CR=1 FL=1